MRIIFLVLILILSSCSTGSRLTPNRLKTIKLQDTWQYPGKFNPLLGEKVAFFYLQGQFITECKIENIDNQLLYNLHNFLSTKDLIEEERRNFIHFKLAPGEAWFVVKSSELEIARQECLKLSKYLVKTFNFKIILH